MLTFLESVGRRSEAELYLRLFHKLPKESFAIIAPGGPVVRHALGSLVEQLRFLSDLDLFAPVVLGLFNPEAAAAGSERLVKRLPSVGLEACPHEMSEPGLAERLRHELRSERDKLLAAQSALSRERDETQQELERQRTHRTENEAELARLREQLRGADTGLEQARARIAELEARLKALRQNEPAPEPPRPYRHGLAPEL